MKRITLLVAMTLGLASPVLAQPPGIASVDGRWQTTDGRPLFFYNAPWAPADNMLCGLECAGRAEPGTGRWAPVAVDAGAALVPPWRSEMRDEQSVLSYRGKVVMTWTGEPGDWAKLVGARSWRRTPDVEALHPLQANDPAITRAPEINPNWMTMPEYPAASRRASETGYVLLDLCLNVSGKVVWADVVRSSGSPRLDDASLKFAFDGMVMTPAIAGPSARAVCGVEKGVNWTLSDYDPGNHDPATR